MFWLMAPLKSSHRLLVALPDEVGCTSGRYGSLHRIRFVG
jgi:hypothetical protein